MPVRDISFGYECTELTFLLRQPTLYFENELHLIYPSTRSNFTASIWDSIS